MTAPARRPVLRRAAAVAVTALAVLGACSSDDDPSSDGASGDDAATTTTTAAGAATSAPAGALADVRVGLTDLGLGLDQPIDLTFRPGSTSLLVAEREGRVREVVLDGDTARVVDEPVLDITDRVSDADGERGLLGLAVSADGQELYLSYTEPEHGDSRIDAFPLSGDDGALRADAGARRELVAIRQPFPNHNGGSLAIGPDGMLYAGFGDGGSADDPEGNGQDPETLLGKVLRLDPRGLEDADGDGIPDSNPFVTPRADGRDEPPFDALDEIWLTGVRNPWRLSFDSQGRLWVADVGQNEFEEIDVLWPDASTPAGSGANLGWDLFEGDSEFESPDPAPGAASEGPFTRPVYVYSHADGCSITGGVVYEGAAIPALQGAYLFGDYCSPGIRALRLPAGATASAPGTPEVAALDDEVTAIAAFGRGPDGEVYVVSLDEGVQRLTPA